MTRRFLLALLALALCAPGCEKAPRDRTPPPAAEHPLTKPLPVPVREVPPPIPPPPVRDDDFRHRLFQAVAMTGDSDRILRMLRDLDLIDAANNGLQPGFNAFVEAHSEWAQKNIEFITEVTDPQRAKDWVAKNYP